jgi:alkanesulfonate monooxygenase SsuD/methylene tetrahydromethanopterin reductase-like flavin-dependent oxidoreductase (luciferase family)
MMGTPTLGVMHDFRQPLPRERSYAAYYAECLDEVAEADLLGFDTVWMSEHHLTADGFLPSPLVMSAAIAARTRRIRIGTSILVLPLHNPLRIAEDAAVADLISGGRMILGVGQGYAEHEFAGFGVDRRHRSSLLEENVEILRQALTGGRVTFHGQHWSFDDLPVTPSPARRVPLYIGGTTEPALRRAIRIGDGVIIYCATPQDFRARRALLDIALAGQRDTQTTASVAPASVPLVCTGILHVADDPDQAWAEASTGIAYLEGGIASYSNTNAVVHDRANYLVGTPEVVARRLAALHDDVRFDHFAYWARLPGLSHARAMESLRMVASRVLPALAETTQDRRSPQG